MKRLFGRERIVKDASYFSGSSYIVQTLFFIKGFLNARFLGPALYGLWSALNIILNYSCYVHLGCLNAMNKEIPYQKGRRVLVEMERVINVTFTICVAAGLCFSFALFIVTLMLYGRLSSVEIWGLITIGFLAVIDMIFEFYSTLFIALKKFLVVSAAGVIFAILGAILTFILVPVFKIYGVYVVAIVIPLFTLLYLWFKKPFKARICIDTHESFRLISMGFPIVFRNFLEGSIISIAGIMVLLLLGKENMGYYTVGMLAAQFLICLPQSVHRVFEPYIYERYGQTHDILDLKSYLFKPTLAMCLLFPAVMGFYYLLISFFIKHFLSKYAISIYPFFIILVSRFFVSFSPTALAFITALNKQRFLVPVYLASIVILVASTFIFIDRGLGIIAVALGLLISSFFTGTVIFIYAINHYLKNASKCLVYLGTVCLPLLYVMLMLFLNETFVSALPDFFPDVLKLIIKSGLISILVFPLFYIANAKTGIISDIVGFLKVNIFYSKKSTVHKEWLEMT